MQYKALKHKTLPDTYGVIMDMGDEYEIGQSDTPVLQPMTATMQLMENEYKYFKGMNEFLSDYTLVTLNVTEQPDQKEQDAWETRAKLIYEIQSELLKHLVTVVYENGYPIKAVAQATILSLPAMMKLPAHTLPTPSQTVFVPVSVELLNRLIPELKSIIPVCREQREYLAQTIKTLSKLTTQ